VASDESLTTLQVKAVSAGDSSKSGTATVTVTESPPTYTGVIVSPSTASVAKGGNQQFTAQVTGDNNPIQAVTWSIVETNKKPGTTVSVGGLLTVASDESLPTLQVKATSAGDSSKSGTAAVTVTAAPGGEARIIIGEEGEIASWQDSISLSQGQTAVLTVLGYIVTRWTIDGKTLRADAGYGLVWNGWNSGAWPSGAGVADYTGSSLPLVSTTKESAGGAPYATLGHHTVYVYYTNSQTGHTFSKMADVYIQ
jgi:hypothetical protein